MNGQTDWKNILWFELCSIATQSKSADYILVLLFTKLGQKITCFGLRLYPSSSLFSTRSAL